MFQSCKCGVPNEHTLHAQCSYTSHMHACSQIKYSLSVMHIHTHTHTHTHTHSPAPTKTHIRTKPRTHVDTHTHLSMGGLMYSPWPPNLTSSNCLIQDTYASLDCTSPRLGTCTQTHTHTKGEAHAAAASVKTKQAGQSEAISLRHAVEPLYSGHHRDPAGCPV